MNKTPSGFFLKKYPMALSLIDTPGYGNIYQMTYHSNYYERYHQAAAGEEGR